MSLSHQTTASRALCFSPNRRATFTFTACSYKTSSRSFWWGRHAYAQKYSCSFRSPSLCKAQQTASSRQPSRTKGLAYTQIKKDPIFQYRATQGWRLLSSWGKSGRPSRTPTWESVSERERAAAEVRSTRSEPTQEEDDSLARYERLKKRAEEDPFEMLFGGRASRRAWYPWDWSIKYGENPQDSTTFKSAEGQTTQTNTAAGSSASHRGKAVPDEPLRGAAPSVHELEVEEYVYDPISMRRVPKSFNRGLSLPSNDCFTQEASPLNSDAAAMNTSASVVKAVPPLDDTPKKKMESSLGRHLRKGSSPEKLEEFDEKKPQAIKEAGSSQDVDSLRASDIRATFAKWKEDFSQKEKALQDETSRRRQSMRETFEKRMEEIEQQLYKEASLNATVSGSQRQTSQGQSQLLEIDRQDLAAVSPAVRQEIENRVRNAEVRHACEEELQMNSRASQMRNKQEADAKLASEVDAQKAAMESHETQRSTPLAPNHESSSMWLGEGDMSAQVLKYAASERWYKKKAPHALAREREILAKREAQKAKDRDLVREIRNVYESAYGTIESKHRQESVLRTRNHVANNGEVSNDATSRERVSPHPELPMPVPSSVSFDRSEEVEPNTDKVQRQESASDAQMKTTTFIPRPYYTDIKSHPKFQSYMELAWQVEKTDWAILKSMQEVYRINPRCFNDTRASRILARYVQVSDMIQAGVLASTMSDNDFKCLNMWHRLVHFRSTPEKSLSKRKVLAEMFGSPGEQALGKQEITSKPREKASLLPPLKSEKQVYKILALNFDKHEVTSATTSSSLYESSSPPKSAASILSHLSHPASFIPHIEALQQSNFELVAGSRSMLVYKNISPELAQRTTDKPNPAASQDLVKDLAYAPLQERDAAPSTDSPAGETTPIKDNDVMTQNPKIPGGPSIQISWNVPNSSTVKIPSISVSNSKESPIDNSPVVPPEQANWMAPTPVTAQPPDQPSAEIRQSDPAEQASLSRKNGDATYLKSFTNSRHHREAHTQRRRKAKFWKRVSGLIKRSFILGGLCYVVGCFSVWYQKRKEALEKAEEEQAVSLAPRKWY